MYIKQPKKLLIMNILDILKRYTDENHRLSQKEIVELLKNEYDMQADRKSVKRNLMNLIDFGYDLEYSESIRINKNGEEETIYTDWYLNRDFSDAELRLLIDSLLFSKHIPHSQCKQLIEKLSGLSNIYFNSKVKLIRTLTENMPQNKELFYTIEILDEAISKNKKVAFTYNQYDVDKKLHPRREEKYIVNPYQIAATNGRYYLICNYDKYDDISNYRIDRITDIELLDETAKPKPKDWTLPKHMAEHIYMFSGGSESVTFCAKRYIVPDIIDWFGKDVNFTDITEEEVTAHVNVNLEAMRLWAMQYAKHIKILTPPRLTEEIKNDLKEGLSNYEKT